MKLDPKFEVKDNQLYTIAGEKVEFKFIDVNDIESQKADEKNAFYCIVVDQKTIEPEAECYNEEYLAKLRDYLKEMEETGCYGALHVIPEAATEACDTPETVSYVACVKHATRRVKDCENLCGVYLCDKFAKDGDAAKIALLIDELNVKHKQYVYFAGNEVLVKAKKAGEEYSGKIVAL